jgi:hypothetical protein
MLPLKTGGNSSKRFFCFYVFPGQSEGKILYWIEKNGKVLIRFPRLADYLTKNFNIPAALSLVSSSAPDYAAPNHSAVPKPAQAHSQLARVFQSKISERV